MKRVKTDAKNDATTRAQRGTFLHPESKMQNGFKRCRICRYKNCMFGLWILGLVAVECAACGGVAKNYIFQSMLVTPNEFDYAIQLTMDTPETGGLSVATLDEARSWGKVGEEARSVTVYGDATITLPIIVAAARSRLGQ